MSGLRNPRPDVLASKTPDHRHELLSLHARSIRDTIARIDGGKIVHNNSPPHREIRSLERQLGRLLKTADEFGVYIGQRPDFGRPSSSLF